MNIKRTLKYGTNSAILIVVVVTIAVLINMLVSRFDYKIDLTPNKIFSISEESVQIIDTIPANSKVQIYALFDDTKQSLKTYTEILDKYKDAGKGKIEVIYKDPEKNPGLFIEIGYEKATEGVAFIVKMDKRIKALYKSDVLTDQKNEEGKVIGTMLNMEQSITGLIKYVTASETPTVYVTEGHDEVLTNGKFSNFARVLDTNNYELKSINLMVENSIPSDCKILIVASPKKDLAPSEKDILNKYLANGGSAMFMFDAAETKSEYINLQKVLTKYNIEIKDDQVSETDEKLMRPDDKYSFYAGFTTAKINRELVGQNIALLLFKARSFKISSNKKENSSTASLVQSAPSTESYDFITKQTQTGVQDLVVGTELLINSKTSRVIVMGDSDFLEDGKLAQIGGDLASVNIYSLVSWMNWLHEIEDDIIVSPKEIDNKSLNVTAGQSKVILIFTIFIIPLIIFLMSIFVYLRRRHL